MPERSGLKGSWIWGGDTWHAGALCIPQFSKGVTSFRGGCFLKRDLCMDPCSRKFHARGSTSLCDSVPACYSLAILGGPSDQSCLCAGDGVAAGHLSLALLLFWGEWAQRFRFSGHTPAWLWLQSCPQAGGMWWAQAHLSCGCGHSVFCYIIVWFFSWREVLLSMSAVW